MENKITTYEKIMFVLSIYVVIELYISTTITYSQQTKLILEIIDSVICTIFLFDFFRGLKQAKNKRKYLSENWINFVSSIPFLGFLRIGRLARVIRVLRIIRSGRFIYKLLNRAKPMSAFTNLLILNMFFIFFISISFYHAENGINPDIKTFTDSVVWSFVTTVTFSYYNKIYPMTPEGVVISIILVLIRMVLFGTLIGVITDLFIDKDKIKDDALHKKHEEINEKASEGHVENLNERIAGLENKLENIENLLQNIVEQTKINKKNE